MNYEAPEVRYVGEATEVILGASPGAFMDAPHGTFPFYDGVGGGPGGPPK